MSAQLSKHASHRCQQRAIPPMIVQWLLDYGSVKYDHFGGEIHYFDKRSRKRLAAIVGNQVVNRLGHLLDTYLVTREAVVVTVSHRTKRLVRH